MKFRGAFSMNHDDFDKIFEDQVELCRKTLLVKGREYTPDHDRFHNFTVAAGLMGVTPQEALGGFLAKHLVSIYDLLRKNEYVPMEVWEEKLGDAMNYLFLLKGILVEYEIEANRDKMFSAVMTDLNSAQPPTNENAVLSQGGMWNGGDKIASLVDGEWIPEPGYETHWMPKFRKD